MTETVQNKVQAMLKRLLRVGINHWLAKEYEKALDHYLSIRECFDESEPTHLRQYFINLGIFHRALEQHESAIDSYKKALEIAPNDEHDRHDIAALRANLAYALMQVRRYEEAHDNLAQAEVYFARIYDYGNLGEVLETRARVYLAEGKIDEAIRAAQEAYDILRSYSEAEATGRAHRTLGLCWEAKRRSI